MQLSAFDFELPKELIAQYPIDTRPGSRLLCLDPRGSSIQHGQFTDLLELLSPKDLLVMNNSRVFPARLHGQKSTGGKIEMLVERILDESSVLAQLKSSKSPKVGSKLLFPDGEGTMVARQGEWFHIQFDLTMPVLQWLETVGEIPLPGYIERVPDLADRERYQTVYATTKGSVAAPTAGLHFDEMLLRQIQRKGVGVEYVTLHVGAGTFQPVRVDNIEEHQIHSEYLTVPQTLCDTIHKTKAQGGRVIAVGTTTVRSLETAARSGTIQSYAGDSDLFIYPGFNFQCVDAIVTNFHFPKSSLLMLVAAFAGYDRMMMAYQEAIDKKYRFFSYGDAMFITNKEKKICSTK